VIEAVKIDTNEKAGMTELVQYGVEMPDGKQRWVADVGSDLLKMPGADKAVSIMNRREDSWATSWEAGLENWARNLRSAGVEITDDTVFPKRIKRNVTVLVHETETISSL
jgi:hypothetical protein